MTWYQLNKDKTVTKLPVGVYPEEAMQDNTKRVGLNLVGDSRISTVFLFLDHGLSFGRAESDDEHIPILFESMIFGGPHEDYQRRYSTYDEALQGHNNLVRALEEERHPDFYFND